MYLFVCATWAEERARNELNIEFRPAPKFWPSFATHYAANPRDFQSHKPDRDSKAAVVYLLVSKFPEPKLGDSNAI